ncbi:MAG: RNA 2',3'-cyclic phosphodiesterase [Pseudomonadota bacterium]
MADRQRQRLFFALWPGDKEREQLQAYRPLLRGCGGRPVRRENLHLTLAFLGSVDSQTRDSLTGHVDQFKLAPFTLTLDRLGFWPRPRVLWLGSEQVEPGLAALVNALYEAMGQGGLESERRPFRPHITLVRKAHRAPPQTVAEPLKWLVDRFVLVASETRPEGVHYQILREWGLGPKLKVES